MKKLFIFILLCILTISCNKNVSEQVTQKKEENKKDLETVLLWEEACWEKTCALQKYLEDLEVEWKLTKEAQEKTKYYQERLWILLDKYKNDKNIILKAPDYQKYVDDFYEEFFPCTYEIKLCDKKWKYSIDEQNYFLYLFLPKMVWEEFMVKRWWSSQDSEDLTQSIKRKYYATDSEKEAWMKLREEKLNKSIKKFDLSVIDKEKLKTDKDYFNEIILKQNTWLYDHITWNIPTPISWPTIEQLHYARNTAIKAFFDKLNELWVTKEYFFKQIWTSEENFDKLNKKLAEMDKTYSLLETVPSDKYMSHAEIVNYYMLRVQEFNKKWDFKKDVLEARHYILLQYAYDNNDLWNMTERTSYYKSKYNFLWENIFKYAKHMDKVLNY